MSAGNNSPHKIRYSLDEPLYNSMLITNYVLYVKEFYPEIDINQILGFAGIAEYELDDHAHWLSQRQIDRFHKILTEKTGSKDIPREAGRYIASSKASSTLRQYYLGFLSPAIAYRMTEKQVSAISRSSECKTNRLSKNKIEITTTPKPGVHEKPYQCENRIGIFEAIAKLFTGDFAKIEHHSCVHQGDKACIYTISWGNTSSLSWRRAYNFSLLLGALLLVAFFPFLPISSSIIIAVCCVIISLSCYIYSQNHKIKELTSSIETQGDISKGLMDEMSIRYENTQLVQEIGTATSTIFDMHKLTMAVIGIMEKRLDFDRGMIMLADEERSRLVYTTGFGYDQKTDELLNETEFDLDNPHSKGVVVQAFKKQKPFLVNDISQVTQDLSEKSLAFVKKVGAQSFICVPITYENESLGILAVDNIVSKRPFTQSDMNLLTGIASQTAVSIVNAMSFQRLQESEKKYRELVESAHSIIMRIDTDNHITFFNEFAQRFFDLPAKKVIGKNMEDIIHLTHSKEPSFPELAEYIKGHPEHKVVRERESILSSGKAVWIAWTFRPIFESDGQFKGILCIGNDVTALNSARIEKQDLIAQLQVSQKMEAIGTLAGGIAHDFNNILQAIFANVQILMLKNKSQNTELGETLETIERSVQRASDLTRRLLIFGRKVKSKLQSVDLGKEVEQISKMLVRTIPRMIEIHTSFAENLKFINADPVQVEQILMNLALNGRDAMPNGGTLTFAVNNVTLDKKSCKKHPELIPGQFISLEVTDTGTGMSKKIQEHIFEPFYTTKETGKGTGLGLAMVYGIIQNHGGDISCKSKLNKGTTFQILFPAIDQNPDKPITLKKTTPIKGGHETILLVDDEESIREPAKGVLNNFGFKVLTAANGEKAIDIYSKGYDEIDIVLLDLIMPGMGGAACLKELVKINPEVKVIIVSGYSTEDKLTKKEIKEFSKAYINKPYEISQFIKTIRKTLDQ